jgi:hypothetical protein
MTFEPGGARAMALAGELGPMDQRAALTKVVDYVKHRPLCQSGGGNDWTDEDTASCSCGLAEIVAALRRPATEP